MSVLVPLTLHLSVALGVYCLAASLGLLIAPRERIAGLFEEMADSPGLLYAFGLITLAIGSAWIMAHREWTTPLGIAVSLAGWIAAIEGVLLLALPGLMVRIMLVFRSIVRPCAVAGVLIGLVFILLGLLGRPDALGAA